MSRNRKKLFSLLLACFMLTGCGNQGPKGDRGPQGEQGIQGEQGPQGDTGNDGVSVVSIEKTGTQGLVDTYTITYSNQTTSTFTVTNGAKGQSGNDGTSGQDGVSVVSIDKTKTEGLVDTYKITYSNQTTSTFTITNGAAGETGQDGKTPTVEINDQNHWVINGADTGINASGIQGPKGDPGKDGVSVVSIEKTGTQGLVDTYTITYSDQTTSTFTVTNGAQGQPGQQGDDGDPGKDGVSVVSIEKTKSEGLVDTYTITYSNQTTSTFTITNGAAGEAGQDGKTPTISINEKNHWVIDGTDTGISATGAKGDKGDAGDDGLSAYELYCEEHTDYTGSLEDWLNEFYHKDETDYTKYDDFLFTEVTYGGVVGYAANYIGDEDVISYPETFKNLPVLLASVDESIYAPHYDEGELLPTLDEIHFPSTVKVVTISDTIKERYNLSDVTVYVKAGFDRYEAPFYPLDLYYEGSSLNEYRATNLRKYFTFSNVYVKSGSGYTQVVNREDVIPEFLESKYDNEGGLKSQILDLMGGTNEFYRFGSFEFKFPKKFTVNFDGYDIVIPFGFTQTFNYFNDHPGISFENNVLKGDEAKYDGIGYDFTAQVDLGIPNWALTGVSFHLYKQPVGIKVGELGSLTCGNNESIYGNSDLELTMGNHNLSLDFGGGSFVSKFPLKCAEGIDAEIKQDYTSVAINIKETSTYNVFLNLNKFELSIYSKDLSSYDDDLLLEKLKEENGFLELGGAALFSKELYLPAARKLDYKGIKYDVDLSYSFQSTDCVKNADTEHPTLFYNPDKDLDNFGYNNVVLTVDYCIANNLIHGQFSYGVTVYAPSRDVRVGVKLYGEENSTRSLDMMIDVTSLPNNIYYRLNDLTITEDKFAITLNNVEVAYTLAEGSKGELKKGYVEIEPGLYNLTIDLNNETLMIEESNGELTKVARKYVFEYLKKEGANVYVSDDGDDVVVFTQPSTTTLEYSFDFLYGDALLHGDLEILDNEEMEYNISHKYEDSYNLNFNEGFDDFDVQQKLAASVKIEGLFLNYDKVEFDFILRHSPDEFKIGIWTPSRVENNVYYFDNFVLSESFYELKFQGSGAVKEGSFRYVSASGSVPVVGPHSITVPQDIQGHTFNFVFDMNTMIVYAEEVN